MKISRSLVAAFHLLSLSCPVKGCKKDNCYRAVAIQSDSNPNLASRRADCSSVLKVVIDNDKTVTNTISTTIFPPDVTVTQTVTETVPAANTVDKRQPFETGAYLPIRFTPDKNGDAEFSSLEARDIYIVQGPKPTYASACKNLQAYAIACLCFGVLPSVQVIDKKTTTTIVQVTAPAMETTTTLTVTETSTAPPTLKTCAFGTAFGYQMPVAGVEKSFLLNTQSGQGCNRWGWYLKPTLAELQNGISGPLYVGAAGNDITQAINVGIWVATSNAQGRVTVTYLLNPPYTLAQVHVDLDCLPLSTCISTQFTYNANAIPNLPTWSNPVPIIYPTCSGGSMAALVINAVVNILTVTTACKPPVAS